MNRMKRRLDVEEWVRRRIKHAQEEDQRLQQEEPQFTTRPEHRLLQAAAYIASMAPEVFAHEVNLL